MCHGCWAQMGEPRIEKPEVRRMAERLAECEEFGGLHIIVADWNIDDEAVEFCRDGTSAADAERAVATDLLAMTEEERASALAIADGFWGREE